MQKEREAEFPIVELNRIWTTIESVHGLSSVTEYRRSFITLCSNELNWTSWKESKSYLFWVIPVLKRWSNLWYCVGIGGTVVLIVLFVIAVPARGLPVSELELTIELIQIVFIISSIMIVRERTTKTKLASAREP